MAVFVEYSLDSLVDIDSGDFESACVAEAAKRGMEVEFRVGLHNRQTIDGEQSDRADAIVERAFASCCDGVVANG